MIVLCLSDTEAGDSCNNIEGNVSISPSLTGGAILLIVPGFFTDFIGFALLIPFTRNILLKIALKDKKLEKKNDKMNKTIEGEIVNKNKDEL